MILPSIGPLLGDGGAGRSDRATDMIGTDFAVMTDNQPPQLSAPSSKVVLPGVPASFNATAYDPDNDTLRFTWSWGDGIIQVTTYCTDVMHTYVLKKTYDLYIFADDLTGITGHNVSAHVIVQAFIGPTSMPTPLSLTVNKTFIWASQSVLFTATAQDSAGDALHFSIRCGDGTFVNTDTPHSANNEVVTVTLIHRYQSSGNMTAVLCVSDGLSNATYSTPVTITVTLNHIPVLSPLFTKYVNSGTSYSYAATAFDPDGETLRYTWNFSDGTALQAGVTTTHTYAKAGMYAFTVYVSDLTGLIGHNVSVQATVKVAFNLPLWAGWNFVSIPLAGYGYKASNISLTIGDMVVLWNSSRQGYDHTYIKGISQPSADFTIPTGVGFWIWTAAAKTIHLYGSVPTTLQTKTFTLPIQGGWIALGLLGLDTTRHASDIPAMYSGSGSISMVAYYEPPGIYHPYIVGVPQLGNFMLVPGMGYWCWITLGPGGTISYLP